MPSRGNRSVEAYVPWVILTVVLVPTIALWGALSLSHAFNGTPQAPHNIFDVSIGLLAGKQPWFSSATFWLVVEAVVLVAIIAPVLWYSFGRPRRNNDLDNASRHLPVDRVGLRRYTTGVDAPGLYQGAGIALGQLLRNGRPAKDAIRLTWEDVCVVFGGTRSGKTVGVVVPTIMQAPGACIVTSNKSDVYDVTAKARAETGTVWLFDPQHIATDEAPSWWWNPLAGVHGLTDAQTLAAIWAEVAKPKGAQEDAYFDPSARDLLGAMILAAALGNVPLTMVNEWLKASSGDVEPERYLRAQYPQVAASLASIRELPDRQRSGVYATALRSVSWLDNPEISRWVVDEKKGRPAFDPEVFVRSTDTMYLLSREGVGSAAPLVTAFTATLLKAAEDLAQRSPNGRLATPLVAVLDEAANVCRWRQLPDLYSHYGSRSIIVITVFQSWSQGEEVWGRTGMAKLWDAANARLYLGGIPDPDVLLKRISSLCGEWEAPHTSTSAGGVGSSRSNTYSTRREAVIPVGMLASMPQGRAIALLSATQPVVLKTTPWMHSELAERINNANERKGQEVPA